ncbi:flavin reductase family protein [Arthrobacter sp. NPDC092385]|uniref:flavin reductase family protein n=1 Tax=Arthrobacter sp. NPDC092385 TaxID=3363943 RepID=UPI00382FBA21
MTRVIEHLEVDSARSSEAASGEDIAQVGATAEAPAIDARAFRDALGHYASGITVVTGVDEQGPAGFTCQSFYSVSTDPPLVSFSVLKTSTTYPRIRRTGSFAVNVLSSDQRHISDQFARTGTDKWAGIGWDRARTGNPVLDGAVLWLDCEIWAEHDAGDHLIVLGRVREFSPVRAAPADPLLYFKGRYRLLAPDLDSTTEDHT